MTESGPVWRTLAAKLGPLPRKTEIEEKNQTSSIKTPFFFGSLDGIAGPKTYWGLSLLAAVGVVIYI